MSHALKLMAILAHPDDEAFVVGGTLARYAAEGVEVSLVVGTRGEKGRYFDREDRPDDDVVGQAREEELRLAADVLGIEDVAFLDYVDGELDMADAEEAVARIVGHLARVRPQVVVTFGPFGLYGHPDHVAISQMATAACVRAAESGALVDKLYYAVMGEERHAVFREAFASLGFGVDGVRRRTVPWPQWSVSASVDARAQWKTVWRAVQCHRTQMGVYGRLHELGEDEQATLWGVQPYYRAYSLVNGGRGVERDLFAGLR